MRLTKDIKTNIVNDAINEAFKEKTEQLKVEEHEVAKILYYNFYNKKDLEIIEYFSTRGWVETGKYIKVRTRNYGTQSVELNNALPFIEGHKDTYDKPFTPKTDSDVEKCVTLFIKKRHEFKQEINLLRRYIEQILNSCSTDKQLRETWEYADKYLKKHCKEPTKMMIPVSTMKNIENYLPPKTESEK